MGKNIAERRCLSPLVHGAPSLTVPEPDRHPDLERLEAHARCSQWTPVAAEAPIEVRPLAEGGYELALYLRTLPNLGGLLLEASGKPDYVQSRLVAAAVAEMLSRLP